MFCFQVYGEKVEIIIIYQQLQNICMDKVCRINVFRPNLGKISFAPTKNCLLLRC